MSLIDFNIYEYKPNIKRIKKEQTDQYDYLGTCFELTLINPEDNKHYTHEILVTLFIDYYQKNLNFTTEIDSEFIFESSSKFNSKRNTRTFCTQGGDIKLKNIHIPICFPLNEDITKILDNWLKKIIIPKILSMKDFMINNQINYNNNELEETLIIIEERIKKMLDKNYLSNFFPFNIDIIEKNIQQNKLEHNLIKKDLTKKTPKI